MTYTSEFLVDFNVSSLDTISLTNEQIEQAVQSANSCPKTENQWQTYLNTLALLGFESWLNQRASELKLETHQVQNNLNAVLNLKVAEFKICLLIQGVLDDELITLPQTAITKDRLATDSTINSLNSNENIHDFYVLITVDEEQEQISLDGLLRNDRLMSYRNDNNLILQLDFTYEIPLNLFDFEMNHLLLYLRCLDLSAVQQSSPILEAEILNRPTQSLRESVINIASCLQGELNELAEGLSWLLLPTSQLTTAFRSLPIYARLLEQLRNQGVLIPSTARGALKDLNIGELTLQLYALTWLLETPNEWSLLLILGTPDDQPLPYGLTLQIYDENSLLSEQEVFPDQEQIYIYSQVIGEFDEMFTARISLSNGEALTLPPFTYLIP